MKVKVQYRTRQREDLLDYLKAIAGSQVTAAEVYEHFSRSGAPIGKVTVYRSLERLVEEGLVNKYIIDGNSAARFEYSSREESCHRPVCFHCKCEQCGRLIHLECDEMIHMQEHMMEHHGFTLDPLRTVFYGICAECRAAGEPEKEKA